MYNQIYLTDNEKNILRDVINGWVDIMSDGEETVQQVDDALNNGLGSVMFKLYKGLNGQKAYEDYKNKGV